ncbi:MAG: riboflavin biosynthesis protein RibD [Rickettsiales bacterium]|nr:riboflavin biosynthesis protein RibD [Rickettsiales bacterium]OUV79194.1 MAG: riboflavin biosynthesis protein RibD [Rickettsiales bacterium TMED131]|tara:strand:- start:576 stop:1667 length:1092 start_codon:yes stop_codon:yes gene_type:complete
MDSFWLNSAFYQAACAVGKTGKNPAVGCVLVNKNKIVGVGKTSKGGRPHAEENAIKMAGKQANGSTMFITLEPCNLDGNSQSCTRKIIQVGIKKVVIAGLDPNPLTYKKGYNELISNGIEVVIKKTTLKNFLFNFSQLCLYTEKRPMIALKMATSLDSKITNKRKWITSSFSRSHVHQIRSFYDAVLVGTNTMTLDNPSLNIRVKGNMQSNYRIIFDKNLRIKLDSNLLKNIKKNPLIIFTSRVKDRLKYNKIRSKGANIFEVELDKQSKIPLNIVLNNIGETSIKSILLEGGSKTAASFLNKKLIDIFYLYRSSSLVGKNEIDVVDKINNIDEFNLFNTVTLGEDQFEVWINKKIIKRMRKK